MEPLNIVAAGGDRRPLRPVHSVLDGVAAPGPVELAGAGGRRALAAK